MLDPALSENGGSRVRNALKRMAAVTFSQTRPHAAERPAVLSSIAFRQRYDSRGAILAGR